MEYIQESEKSARKDEGGINFRDMVDLVLANWYYFVLSVIICVGAAYFYLLTIQPVYQRQAVMLVKDKEIRFGYVCHARNEWWNSRFRCRQ